jgi:hypothetical protein
MDFGSGFWVKEGLDTVPQQPESLPGIYYEHAVKCLDFKQRTKLRNIVIFHF